MANRETSAAESVRQLQVLLGRDHAGADSLTGLLSAGALALSFACEPETSGVFLAWLRQVSEDCRVTDVSQLAQARDELAQVIRVIEAVYLLPPPPGILGG